MAIEVEAPDGTIIEFPDGTDTGTIKGVMAKQFAQAPVQRPDAIRRPGEGVPQGRARQQPSMSREAPDVGQMQPQPDPLAQPAVTGQPASMPMGGAGRFAPNVQGATIPEPSMLQDVGRSALSGLAKGAIGLTFLPGSIEELGRAGINAADKALGGKEPFVNPESYLPSASQVTNEIERREGKFYKPKTTAGQYASTIGEFAPGLVFPGGAAQRIIGNVVAPAVASETAGQITKDTPIEPVARFAGAMLGGSIPNLPGRAYTPVATSPERRAAVQTLRREGIDSLSAGEVTGSKPLRYLESNSNDIPMSGGRIGTVNERAAEQFTAAALRRAGIQGTRADGPTLDAAFTRIGADFDRLAQASRAQFVATDIGAMRRAVHNYESVTPPSLQAPVVREILQDIETVGRPTGLNGQQYARYRSLIEGMARGAQDQGVARSLRAMVRAIDTAIERGLPPDMRGQWQQARTQYRNMLVLENAATSAGAASAEGLISPKALSTANKSIYGVRGAARGQGDFTELANAGRVIMDPLPNSGTPARLAAAGMGHALGAGAGAIAGGAPGAALGAIASPIAAGLMARTFISRPMQQYLGANARMQPRGVNAREARRTALPSALADALRGDQ